MTICRAIHNKNNPYVITNSSIGDDDRISYKAQGIWYYAFSRKDDWKFYVSDLIKRKNDGRDSVRSGLKELEEFGYLYRKARRDENGKLDGQEWYFFETPKTIDEIKEMFPKDGFPVGREDSLTETPPLTITDYKLVIKEEETSCFFSAEDEEEESGERGNVGGKGEALMQEKEKLEIYSSLDLIIIPDKIKRELTTRYNAQIVNDAMDAVNQNIGKGDKIENLTMYVRRACKDAWKPNKTKVDSSQENAAFANEMLAKCQAFKKTPYKPSDTYLYIGPDYAEIVMVQGAERFLFNQVDFKEKLTERLVYRQLIAA